MHEIRYWACDLCGQNHKTKTQALKCEESHLYPKSIVSQSTYYSPATSTYPQYPRKVILRMNDESLAQYLFDMPIKEENINHES